MKRLRSSFIKSGEEPANRREFSLPSKNFINPSFSAVGQDVPIITNP